MGSIVHIFPGINELKPKHHSIFAIFVGVEQSSVMLEIKFQFFVHTITSDIHAPQRL